MASTSAQLRQDGASLPSGSSCWKYDVFLSFRGTDTRNDFVDHLYSALHEKVIFTFKDDQRLERGESISPALLKAIEESRFAVVVFSENYASSKWCLEELVKILECKKTRAFTVLPVYYKVDPSDLRKQRGSVGEAFAKHERDSNEEEERQKVQRWRNALTEAANISGWDSETHGAEAKLVRDIAIDILNRLGYNGSSDLEDVVGLLPRVAEVMSKLEMGLDLDDPRVVGICGMGGIGKTTIAKAVYHQIRTRFQASCYLPNVREAADGKHGLESLQKSLLVDIRLVSDSDIKIRNIDWPWSIRNAVGNKRVLVVLDDVDHSDQLDVLIGTLDWFGPGSRIMITTRNSHLLARYGPRSHVYNVEGLNDKEAFKLFCCKAFWNNQPTPSFEDLIKSAVDYAKGVPLALRVLGCFLIGRKVNEWQSAIHRLRQEPNPDIQKVLKLSYDRLGREEQEIFLDIACFFKWYSMEYCTVVNLLDACGFHADIGIRVLEDKALVTIKDNILTRDKKIDMHDLIQEMGWHIVNEESLKEPDRRSRLWKYEDIYHTLTKKTGTKAVETIVLDSHGTKEISLSPDAFSEMSKLRLLKLSNVQLPNGLDYLSNDLRLVDWHGYPLKYLPSNFQPDCLVTVNLSHSCLKLWNGRTGANLKELILEGCTNLVEISSIEAIKRLKVLNLRGWKNLKVLPSGICGLKLLKSLNVSGCSKLSTLPENLGGLERLEFISLDDCKELTSLPSGICGLKFLLRLSVSGCSKLSKLPENLGELESLRYLVADFTAIKQPPSSIMHLKKLEYLSFTGCKGPLFSSFFIQKEPMGFELPALSGGLRSLGWLDISDCNFSEGFLPDDLGSLSSLKFLYLSGANIISLPTSIRDLYELNYLYLRNCKKLKTLPFLPPNIKEIYASGCTSLETLTESAIFPRLLFTATFTNCDTLLKKMPSLLLELLRNILKVHLSLSLSLSLSPFFICCNRIYRVLLIVSLYLSRLYLLQQNKEESHKEKSYREENYIVVPGGEIPEGFMYQNNMGHYVGIQVMPDWYERLRGIFVCAVFEATAPSIDAKPYIAECYVMWNDVVVYSTEIYIGSVQFQSDHLFLHYISGYDWVGEIRRRAEEVNDLKKNEIIFYFTSSCPEIIDIGGLICKLIAPVKCAVDMVYEKWPDHPHLTIQQSDYDYKEYTREQSNPKRM
ncbi:disease resistance protein RUN1-like isoform X2 [Diospyros lotus]|uniref:disease resistance protein RUN1-like isoform X2 n=1 Tax=Diospyros lotus TaxID=55363 RepID=UPI00225A519E|nr:disease resistance protein RUN1-like isoform X2 [Diospyros lotus]